MLEERLREAIAREVEKVTPGPDPYRRLVSRRRWRRRIRGAAAVVLVAAAGAVTPALITAGRPDAGHSEMIVRLLEAPPRGVVGADAAYAAALAAAVEENNRDAEDLADLDRTAVLMVDDVGDARIAIVASYSDRQVAFQNFVAPRGADPAALARGGVSAERGPNLRPFPMFVADSYVPYAEHLRVNAAVGVAPDGCRVGIATDPSNQHYSYTLEPSYVVRDDGRTTEWWEVLCGDTIHYQGPPGAGQAWYSPAAASTDVAAAMVGARGTVDREGARLTIESLLSDRVRAAGQPRVLWGGESPAGGVTVAAVPVDGGAWRVKAFLLPTASGRSPDAPVVRTAAALDDPDTLLAVRLPGDGADARVLVLAPPGAAAVAALDPAGTPAATARVRGGFALLPADGADLTFEARNAKGGRIAATTLPPAEPPGPTGPAIDAW